MTEEDKQPINLFWDVVLLPWFGHGRMMEFNLTAVCILVSVILLVKPEEAFGTLALFDVGWLVGPRWIAMPFILKATFSGTGLAFNITGLPYSRQLRFVGGLVGFMIWFWLTAKFVLTGALLMSFPFTAVAAYSSIRIMAFSLVDLPKSGAPPRYA